MMVKKSQQRGRKRTLEFRQWGLKGRGLGYVVHDVERPSRKTWRRRHSFDPIGRILME